MNIHQKIADLSGLANVYAMDGAFYSAAKTFRRLADVIEIHAGEIAKDYPESWSGSPSPEKPDSWWLDDATGEYVSSESVERITPEEFKKRFP